LVLTRVLIVWVEPFYIPQEMLDRLVENYG
jgi:hypothetical protein